MASPYKDIAEQAMKLSARERVRLAQQLVSSLDNEVETDVEALWLAESERRLQELRSGAVKGIDSGEAFRAARQTLRR